MKVEIFKISSTRVKIRQIPHVNFELTVNYSSSFASFFIVMTHNSPVNFKLIRFILWIKGSNQSCNFETLSALVKVFQTAHVIFEAQVSFPSNFASILSAIKNNSSVLF